MDEFRDNITYNNEDMQEIADWYTKSSYYYDGKIESSRRNIANCCIYLLIFIDLCLDLSHRQKITIIYDNTSHMTIIYRVVERKYSSDYLLITFNNEQLESKFKMI